jgi:hypothetical protein
MKRYSTHLSHIQMEAEIVSSSDREESVLYYNSLAGAASGGGVSLYNPPLHHETVISLASRWARNRTGVLPLNLSKES